jgi:Short C-terminal domain
MPPSRPVLDRAKEDENMPGLLRGVARTAVVAGTATAVSNRVSRRQANRWATQDEAAYYEQQQQQYAQPYTQPAAAPEPDPIEQLQRLGDLKAQGILTDEEFQAQKAKLLA